MTDRLPAPVRKAGDTFKVYAPNPTALIHGHSGTDTVDYSNFGQGVSARLAQGVQSGPLRRCQRSGGHQDESASGHLVEPAAVGDPGIGAEGSDQ